MTDQRPTAPLYGEGWKHRRCSRLLGVNEDGSERNCGKAATVHVIYRWGENPTADNPDLDHGYCCPEHWQEYRERWSCAGHHDIGDSCGMPGSRIALEGCFFDDLPTAEPVRAVAEQKVFAYPLDN